MADKPFINSDSPVEYLGTDRWAYNLMGVMILFHYLEKYGYNQFHIKTELEITR